MKYVLDPQYADIHAKIDSRKSSFSAPGIMDAQVENFRNSVTEEEQDTRCNCQKALPGSSLKLPRQ
jgi:hypothetical protein